MNQRDIALIDKPDRDHRHVSGPRVETCDSGNRFRMELGARSLLGWLVDQGCTDPSRIVSSILPVFDLQQGDPVDKLSNS